MNAVNNFYVYIMASSGNGTLYNGMNNDFIKRVYQHKNDLAEEFTKKYKVHNLVYYEYNSDVKAAISRENQIKIGKGIGKLN